MGKNNDRCPLQAECERKCAFVGRELDCDYYGANARPGYEIDDQEERRRAQEEKPARKPTLGQIAAKARRLHMSYGEFVARYGI